MTDTASPATGANVDMVVTPEMIEAANKPIETPAPEAPKELETKETAEPVKTEAELEKTDEGKKPEEVTPEQAERKRSRARERIETLSRENRELRQRIAAIEKTAATLEGGAKTPNADQFESDEDYQVALAETAAAKAAAKAQRASKDAIVEQINQQRSEMWGARVEAAKVEIPDFDKVAFAPELPVNEAMGEVIQDSDKGPEILYYLGKNPAEASRIASLPAERVAYELGKLEGKLTATAQPRKISTAPPPVQTLQGTKSKGDVDLMELDYEAYKKARGFPE